MGITIEARPNGFIALRRFRAIASRKCRYRSKFKQVGCAINFIAHECIAIAQYCKWNYRNVTARFFNAGMCAKHVQLGSFRVSVPFIH